MLTLSKDLQVRVLVAALPCHPAAVVGARQWCHALRQLLDHPVHSVALWRALLALLDYQPPWLTGQRIFTVTINGLERSRPEEPAQAAGEYTGTHLAALFKERFLLVTRCEGFFLNIGVDLPVDPDARREVQQWEKRHGMRLPESVRGFFMRRNIGAAVTNCYPTNNYLPSLSSTMTPLSFADGSVLLLILNENQGCCFWYTRFDPDRAWLADAPVLVGDLHLSSVDDLGCDTIKPASDDNQGVSEEDFKLDNASFACFWELQAKDGRQWYHEVG